MAIGSTKPSLKSVYSPIRLTRPGARNVRTYEADCADTLAVDHLADHVQYLLAVTDLQRRQVAAQFADELHFLGIGDTLVLEHVAELGVERAGDAAQGLKTRDGMPVFHARNVTAHQAAPLLQVSLREAPPLPKIAYHFTYVHK